MNMLKRYKLDRTTTSSENLVKDEIHVLSGEGDDICFTRNGAFFNKSLIVKQGTKILALNKDYVYCFFWQDATKDLGNPVSVAIQIKNRNLIGKITLTYQAVGGQYQNRYTEMDSTITGMSIEQTRNVYWDEVLEIPTAFIPTRHLHRAADIYGIQPLVEAVYRVKDVMSNASVLKLRMVYDRFLQLKRYVEENLGDIDNYKRELNLLLETARANDGSAGITVTQMENIFDRKYNTLVANLTTELANNKANALEKFNTIVTTLTRLDTAVTELKTTEAILATTVNQIKANEGSYVNEVVTTVTNNVTADNQAVRDKVSQLADIVDIVSNKVTTETTALSGYLESAKVTLRGEIAALGTSIIDSYYTPNKTAIDKLISDLSELASRIDNNIKIINEDIENKERKNKAKIVSLENKINALETRLQALEMRGNA